jgi:hypothetical protein
LFNAKGVGLYHPIVIKEDAGGDICHRSASADYPEIQLGRARRLYHYGKLAAHLLGMLEKFNRNGEHFRRKIRFTDRAKQINDYNKYRQEGWKCQVLVDSLT